MLKGQGWDAVLAQRLKQFYKEYDERHGRVIQDDAAAVAGGHKTEGTDTRAGHDAVTGAGDSAQGDRAQAAVKRR